MALGGLFTARVASKAGDAVVSRHGTVPVRCAKCGGCQGGGQVHQGMRPKATPRAGDPVAGSTSGVRLVLGVRGKRQEFNIVYSHLVCFRDFCRGIPTASLGYLLLLRDVSHMGSRIILFLANIKLLQTEF